MTTTLESRFVTVEVKVLMSRESSVEMWQLDEAASYLYRRVEGLAQEAISEEGSYEAD